MLDKVLPLFFFFLPENLNFICLHASFLLLDFGLYMTFQFFIEKELFKKFPTKALFAVCPTLHARFPIL